MDISNIIKRLQDVDKLKMVLLDENQRKIFECIPKPGIVGKSKKKMKLSRYWTLDIIRKLKKSSSIQQIIKKYDVDQKNPIKKRILEILDYNEKASDVSPDEKKGSSPNKKFL